MRSIEELLETPYHIIDILPEQVKADGPGSTLRSSGTGWSRRVFRRSSGNMSTSF